MQHPLNLPGHAIIAIRAQPKAPSPPNLVDQNTAGKEFHE